MPFGERFASTSLVLDDSPRNITSGSFLVTDETFYNVSMLVRSIDGKIYYINPNTGLPQEEKLEAIYGAEIEWFNDGSSISTDVVLEGSGATLEGGPLTDYTLGIYDYIHIPNYWKIFSKILESPENADGGKVKIYASYQKPSTHTLETYKDVIRAPRVDVDDVRVFQPNTSFSISGSALFDTTSGFDVVTPSREVVSYEMEVTSGSPDCYGEHLTEVFDNTGPTLHFGHGTELENYLRSWMPFEIDFDEGNGGVHITNATIEVTATKSMANIIENPCKVTIVFDSRANPTDPSNVATLWGVPFVGSPLNKTIAESWIEGETYSFDITHSARSLFGERGVVWNNGENAAVIIGNWGSGQGAYQSFASNENERYPPPKLTIKYQDNYYLQKMWDLTILNVTWETKHSEKVSRVTLDIGVHGADIRRGLSYFKLGSIPSGATINESKLYLYLSSNMAKNDATLTCYPLRVNWDYYTANWNRRYGTQDWEESGASSDTEDYYSTYSGSTLGTLSLTGTETSGSPSEGWQEITLDSDIMEAFVSKSLENNGIKLQIDTETDSIYRFTSSQSFFEDLRPYLTVDYDHEGSNYNVIIKNEVYAEGDPDPEDPTDPDPPTPPDPEFDLVTRIAMINYSLLGTYTFSGSYRNRYILILESSGYEAGGYFTSITLGGRPFTKIREAGAATISSVLTQAWGLVVPDSWNGQYSFVRTKYGTTPRAEILVFANVDPASPIFGSGSNAIWSSASQSSSLSVPCHRYGAVYDILGLNCKDKITVPVAGSGQTRLYHRTGNRGISVLKNPVSANVTMSWSFSPVRTSQVAVSLRPKSK